MYTLPMRIFVLSVLISTSPNDKGGGGNQCWVENTKCGKLGIPRNHYKLVLRMLKITSCRGNNQVIDVDNSMIILHFLFILYESFKNIKQVALIDR